MTQLETKLDRLEAVKAPGRFFLGEDFSLVDGDLGQVAFGKLLGTHGQFDGLFEQQFEPLGADAFWPTCPTSRARSWFALLAE